MTPPMRPDPRVMKAIAAYKKQGLNRLSDLAGLSQGTGDAVQSFAMGATEPLEVGKALKAARRGIEAWHGSPHKFDKFSLDKIGTGEGAQAYGHGLYFAESPEVAKGYRRDLTRNQDWKLDAGSSTADVPDWLAQRVSSGRVTIDDAIRDWEGRVNEAEVAAKGDHQPWLAEGQLVGLRKTLEGLRSIRGANSVSAQQPGSLYRVRLDVSPDELLDWDKAVQEQPWRVRDALTADPLSVDRRWPHSGGWKTMPGGEAMRRLGEALGGVSYGDWQGLGTAQARVSKELDSRGVKGIRYLDGGSRAAGDGTRNYVIFDPERIQILERLAALGLGGQMVKDMLAKAKAAAQPQQQPPTLPAVTVGR